MTVLRLEFWLNHSKPPNVVGGFVVVVIIVVLFLFSLVDH